MSSELRAKIANTIQECHRKGIAHYGEIAEHILALEGYIDRTPPATAKLPEGVEIVETNAHPKFDVRTATQYLGRDGRWRKRREDDDNVGCFGTREEALTTALSAPPVPGESKPMSTTETADDAARRFAGQCIEKDARIAELEAENTRLRAQYDMVEQERTRLMLGQQVPYTPAAKPDPRTIAPNGRAMVSFLVRDFSMWGLDDSGKWWTRPTENPADWSESQDAKYTTTFPGDRVPCAYDGTPITETKPDPLARAVTVGEFNEKMQRLADIYVRAGMPTTAKFIRDAFTSTQGAAHAE